MFSHGTLYRIVPKISFDRRASPQRIFGGVAAPQPCSLAAKRRLNLGGAAASRREAASTCVFDLHWG